MSIISEDDFERDWKPIPTADDENALRDNLHDVAQYPREQVWTVVEGDSGDLYAQAGIHVVNRIGYVATEKAWVTGEEEAVYHSFQHYARPDDDPTPGDRCKDCGQPVTWVGPSHTDWEHI